MKISNQTRHVATITVYTYGLPEEALQEAQSMCDEINHRYDSNASVEELHEQRFGTVDSKKIDIKTLK